MLMLLQPVLLNIPRLLQARCSHQKCVHPSSPASTRAFTDAVCTSGLTAAARTPVPFMQSSIFYLGSTALMLQQSRPITGMCLTNAHESKLFYLEVGVWLTFTGGHFFALLVDAKYLTGVKSTSGIHSNVLTFMPKIIKSVMQSF